MSITVGTGEIKCAYLGSTALKEIYVGTTKVYPTIKEAVIDFLLVGGGGGGGYSLYCTYWNGGGGGAGGLLYCQCYKMAGSCNVVIGAGGITYCPACSSGKNSYFGNIVAYGGGGGGSRTRCNGNGYNGGSGGGGGAALNCNNRPGGTGVSGQGYNGGNNCSECGGGGGGAGGVGCDANRWADGCGGPGCQISISGANEIYACGGAGGGLKAAEGYGSGGSGHYSGTSRTATNGCQGVFIARYPTACGYNITGGTKYTCGNYTIHCFTSNGTLTVN